MGNKRYIVVLNIGVKAKSKKEAREKVKAAVTSSWYKNKFMQLGVGVDFNKAEVVDVSKLPF